MISAIADKLEESEMIIRKAIETFKPKATITLFSGGDDSTKVLHLCNLYSKGALHCNTEIGIEETRIHARKVCEDYQIPLTEMKPPEKDSYVNLVMKYGFPGGGFHRVTYARLKERAIRQVARQGARSSAHQRQGSYPVVCRYPRRRIKTPDVIQEPRQ